MKILVSVKYFLAFRIVKHIQMNQMNQINQNGHNQVIQMNQIIQNSKNQVNQLSKISKRWPKIAMRQQKIAEHSKI